MIVTQRGPLPPPYIHTILYLWGSHFNNGTVNNLLQAGYLVSSKRGGGPGKLPASPMQTAQSPPPKLPLITYTMQFEVRFFIPHIIPLQVVCMHNVPPPPRGQLNHPWLRLGQCHKMNSSINSGPHADSIVRVPSSNAIKVTMRNPRCMQSSL